MIRAPLTKALCLGANTSPIQKIAAAAFRTTAVAAQTPAKAPEKIEVFVDDIPVHVEPGTTILQVSNGVSKTSLKPKRYRLLRLQELKSQDSVITRD